MSNALYGFGFVIYGAPSPYSVDSSAVCIYTDSTLPATTAANGYPAELVGATVLQMVAPGGRPGLSWGADPRNPTGAIDVALSVKLLDDTLGTLGTLFMRDPDAGVWGLNTNRLAATGTSVSVTGTPAPAAGIYYVHNEAVTLSGITTSTSIPPITSMTLARAQCGSLARAHVLRPSDFSAGEDGSQDRVDLTRKPNFEHNFYCGLYLFKLDQFGAVESYILRRGIIVGEPTPRERPMWEFSIKYVEDLISEHKIGQCQTVTVGYPLLVTKVSGTGAVRRAEEIDVILNRARAEALFNEPCGLRGFTTVDGTVVGDLNTRLTAGAPKINYVLKVTSGDEWLYSITSVAAHTLVAANGSTSLVVKVHCKLIEGSPNATVIDHSTVLKPWWSNSQNAQGLVSGAQGSNAPPTLALRLRMLKSVVEAFLLLCVSDDGSTGGTYDKLIGGIGCGIPVSFFNVGSAVANLPAHVLAISGNTSTLAQLNQLLAPPNTYHFDLTASVNLKEFIANELVASLLLMGPLQHGAITLRSWVHEVTGTVTLAPIDDMLVTPGERLKMVKRLDLSVGVKALTLEPEHTRSVRYHGAQNVQPDEVQNIRFWRAGLNLSNETLQPGGDLAQLIRAFYKMLGGSPFVYEVPCPMADHINNGLSFGDAVIWSDAYIPTPSGIGISGQFIIVGIDLDYDSGALCRYRLIKNTLYSTVTAPINTGGKVAPALPVTGLTRVSASSVVVEVKLSSGANFDPVVDFGGIFDAIKTAGDPVKVLTMGQAPIGVSERAGSVDTHVTITSISSTGAGVVTLTLTAAAAEQRGDFIELADALVVGESHLLLPAFVPAEVALAGAQIAANAIAAPASQNFLSFQPKATLSGVQHTFAVG